MDPPTAAPRTDWAEASFDDFFLATATRAVGLVALVTGNAASAEDATQAAYARAAERWDTVSRTERPDMWVVKVAARIAVDEWRRRRRERPLDDRLRAAQSDVDAAWVRWGLGQLSERQRAAVVLHHAYGLPLDEVAASMETSRDTVKTHLLRGRRRLRRLFSEDQR